MIVYTVQKGDSLWQIARRYGVGLDSLIAANPQLGDPNYLMIGQQINVPELWPDQPRPEVDAQCPATCANGERPCIYLARQGETLADIATMFHTPLTRLLYFNLRYGKRERLPEGARIIIPEPDGLLPQPCPQPEPAHDTDGPPTGQWGRNRRGRS